MNKLSVAISKQIGWDKPPCLIPTREQVQEAIKEKRYFHLLYWNRFCVSPSNAEEVEALKMIIMALPIVRDEIDKKMEEVDA